MELGGLPHQAELGVQIRLLLTVGEGVPVSVSTMTRGDFASSNYHDLRTLVSRGEQTGLPGPPCWASTSASRSIGLASAEPAASSDTNRRERGAMVDTGEKTTDELLKHPEKMAHRLYIYSIDPVRVRLLSQSWVRRQYQGVLALPRSTGRLRPCQGRSTNVLGGLPQSASPSRSSATGAGLAGRIALRRYSLLLVMLPGSNPQAHLAHRYWAHADATTSPLARLAARYRPRRWTLLAPPSHLTSLPTVACSRSLVSRNTVRKLLRNR